VGWAGRAGGQQAGDGPFHRVPARCPPSNHTRGARTGTLLHNNLTMVALDPRATRQARRLDQGAVSPEDGPAPLSNTPSRRGRAAPSGNPNIDSPPHSPTPPPPRLTRLPGEPRVSCLQGGGRGAGSSGGGPSPVRSSSHGSRARAPLMRTAREERRGPRVPAPGPPGRPATPPHPDHRLELCACGGVASPAP